MGSRGPRDNRTRINREGRGDYLQSTMPTSQTTHTLGLYAGHTQEILGIGEVGRELG
jgi:hypothetical protein